jgi:hypothetical protein
VLADSTLPAPRDELFDLAVNRAYRYATRLGVLGTVRLEPAIRTWYAATRFAYRIPLADILAVLASAPDGDYCWQGGPGGGWQPGEPSRP